mmetsp:Transcript_20064/g.25859  ORF Transcript_20064/g.25859 Transcript_20064/m.25859 type:complete len:152 (-) Transcript_20064:99-554(-)|eukprot:CAMPEP_0198141818 /NCGR_PEP_ID=MMETSP1443-20131203/4756_1 /TAXON_ID=186043 /ORGANISM="Entomoneis sp., Strain CCMP2396" /LENGTH=151 /DNA_ID=CAMNT_0043804675 /DNA_START=234 /DNA_END=689 /DNA_ORIENTATION=+
MNVFRQLKNFLYFEAHKYWGVEVKFIKKSNATLTIYENGVEQEVIDLHQYNDMQKLHNLFQEKGFYKKTEEVLRKEALEKKQRQRELAAAEKESIEEQQQKDNNKQANDEGDGEHAKAQYQLNPRHDNKQEPKQQDQLESDAADFAHKSEL